MLNTMQARPCPASGPEEGVRCGWKEVSAWWVRLRLNTATGPSTVLCSQVPRSLVANGPALPSSLGGASTDMDLGGALLHSRALVLCSWDHSQCLLQPVSLEVEPTHSTVLNGFVWMLQEAISGGAPLSTRQALAASRPAARWSEDEAEKGSIPHIC